MKTKYCDFIKVKTKSYFDVTDEEKDEMTNLLQCYYISTDRIFHTIVKKDIDSYFEGSTEPPMVSFYKDSIISDKLDTYIFPTQGIITSRSIRFFHRPTLSEPIYTEIPIYYIDSLCIHRCEKKTEISRKLLQTHEYNQRIKNPNITISLIKAEVELFDGMIPLFQYHVYTYHLRNIFFPALPPKFQLVQIYKNNLDILTDLLYKQSHSDFTKEKCQFDICFIPDMGLLISLIRRRLLYVYCVQREGNIFGIYFIKNAKLRYEDVDGNTLQLIASIMTYEGSDMGQLFYLGFLHSLQQIIKKRPSFKMLLIDDIGHNQVLNSRWREKHSPIFNNNAAYYLFNMIFPCSPIESSRCLVLHC